MLIATALFSIAITIVFTLFLAIQSSKAAGQSIRDSLSEAWTNVAIGFGINYVANLIVLPLAGLPVSAGGAFWIGCIFTAISVLRSFIIRRAFNFKMVASSKGAK